MHNFEDRVDEITDQLTQAAESVGFFILIDHGISKHIIDSMLAMSKSFFDLPDEVKATVPWSPNNVGWGKHPQIRSYTGQLESSESYQLQFGENMSDFWVKYDDLPGFRTAALDFMNRAQQVSECLMRCFARGLGFPETFFIDCHGISRPNSQTTMRLLHYFALPEAHDGRIYHRAGAHADWGFLTLLFLEEGQSGLEICPGREVVTECRIGNNWTKVEAETGDIVCNVGDLLMSWSDDRFKSTFHRVEAYCEPDNYFGDQYSIAYFNQPCKDSLIQGPLKKYPMVTGAQFTECAVKRNFACGLARNIEVSRSGMV
ncbi:Oxoglutarate/iron-dependent dioxygenase [Penicillium sp. IBT 31633x]|nr:Oxoglutarate/iron-dependent dioxygenase [Penicillium sp. IBT 31633x]